MKKKSLSLLIAVAMATTMVPSTMAFADTTAPVEDTQEPSYTEIKEAPASTYAVTYDTHIQKRGWDKSVKIVTGDQEDMGKFTDAGTSGTIGKALRVEALKLKGTNLPEGASIEYRVHQQTFGWSDVAKDGAEAGVTGKAKRAEAVQITLKGMPGYAIKYQVHVQKKGWMDPVVTENGTEAEKAAVAGTTGQALRIEAIRIQIVKTDEEKTAEVAAINAVAKAEATKTAEDIEAAKEAVAAVKDATVKAEQTAKVEAITGENPDQPDYTGDVKFEAVGAKTLKVTFDEAVDTEKASFTVKKGTVKVNTSSVSWNDDKTEATIQLAGKLTEGEYSVEVSGVSDEVLSSTIKAENEKVSKIEVLSDEAPLIDSDSDSDSDVDDLEVGYRVLNQYGEDITKTTALTTSSNNVTVDPTKGIVTIVGDYDVTINKTATFTLIHAATATTTTATVTAVSESKISDISMVGLYNKDGKELTETSNLSRDLFYVELEAKDQYGNVITDNTKLSNEIIVTQSNPVIVNAASGVTVITVNGEKKVVIALSGPTKVGENVVTAIARATGKSASYNAKVGESQRAYNVDIQAPELAVATETVDIPVIVTDKNGELVTDLAVLTDSVRGIKITQGSIDVTSRLIEKDGAIYLHTTLGAAGYESFVIISNATQKVDTLTLEVKAAAVPTTVIGLKDTSTTLKTSDTLTISASNLLVEDQYGRAMSSSALSTWLGLNSNAISVVDDVNSNIVTLSTATINAGTSNGTEDVTIALAPGGVVDSSSAKEFTFRVTDGTEYVSYEVDSIGTVYDEVSAGKTNADVYDKSINVYGVLNDGSKVKLTISSDYTITSTNTTVQTDVADGTIDGPASALDYADNATTVAIPVTVTINRTGTKLTQDVIFSKEAPKIVSIKVVSDGQVGSDAVENVSLTGSTFGIADLTTGSTYDVVVTDQYGVSKKATSTTGEITFDDGTDIAAPKVTIVPGSIFNGTIANNGKEGAAISSLSSGDTFKVTLDYGNGATHTVNVVVQ